MGTSCLKDVLRIHVYKLAPIHVGDVTDLKSQHNRVSSSSKQLQVVRTLSGLVNDVD
jgi:hypothetical protein